MEGFCENQFGMWNLQRWTLYSLLLFANCVLYILVIDKIYNKPMKIYIYFFFESWLLDICQYTTRARGRIHGPLQTRVRIFILSDWKLLEGSEQRNGATNFWVSKNHSGCHFENWLKEVRGDTGRQVWRLMWWSIGETTGLGLGWWWQRGHERWLCSRCILQVCPWDFLTG